MSETIPDPRPEGHPPVPHGRIGLLIVNLGTPTDTTYRPIRAYLKEFLMDKRVVDTNRLIWWPILHGLILTRRPPKVAKAYRAIWNTKEDESPLRTFTRSQCEKLSQRFSAEPRLLCDWAMRYGTPSIPDKINALLEKGVTRLFVMPLYPHYCAATTATVQDKVFDTLKSLRWQPALRTLPPYHDHPVYIAALAQSVKTHLASIDWEPKKLIASYHGIPKRYFLAGDPYHCHCQKTSRLLANALHWPPERIVTTFQSRFGPEEWLHPYTDKTLEDLPAQDIKDIAIITPGFAADCLETLEEIAIAGKETFLEAGGRNFTFVPSLNDHDLSIDLLEHLARSELSAWLHP